MSKFKFERVRVIGTEPWRPVSVLTRREWAWKWLRIPGFCTQLRVLGFQFTWFKATKRLKHAV